MFQVHNFFIKIIVIYIWKIVVEKNILVAHFPIRDLIARRIAVYSKLEFFRIEALYQLIYQKIFNWNTTMAVFIL